MIRRLKQRGDTMVEVMITIAVITLVLAAAYATTNKSSQSLQDSQERTQAVKLVQSQIELLRASNGMDPGKNGGCFTQSGQVTTDPDTCQVDSSGLPSKTEPYYNLSIQKDSASGTYTVKAVWDSIYSGGGKDNVTMYYRPTEQG